VRLEPREPGNGGPERLDALAEATRQLDPFNRAASLREDRERPRTGRRGSST
jgi:hypothetical protein